MIAEGCIDPLVERTTITIGGKDYQAIKAYSTLGEETSYEITFFINDGPYLSIVVIGTADEANLQQTLNSFYTVA